MAKIIPVTLNPSDMGTGFTLSNGNLTFVSATNGQAIRSTHGKTTGKWYWEVKLDSGNIGCHIGVANRQFPLALTITDVNWRSYYGGSARIYPENVVYGSTWATGNVIGVALDMDNGTLEFYKNGVSMGVSHTNLKELGEAYPVFASATTTSKTVSTNFGATPVVYGYPQGYKPYNVEISNKFLISSEDKYYSIKPDIPTVYSADVVAKMTSTNAPTGYAVSANNDLNNGNYIAWKAFDDSESYGWLTQSGILTGYLRVQIPTAKTIKAYRISNADNILLTNASEWTFEGSNDGVNWTVLDKVKDNPFTTKGESRMYYINNNYRYSYYQFNCTKNSGHSSHIGLGEIELFEEVSPYVFQTLVLVEDKGEQSLVRNGMNKEDSIDLNKEIGNLNYISNQNIPFGSGKVFRQPIDRSKHKAHKIILGK